MCFVVSKRKYNKCFDKGVTEAGGVAHLSTKRRNYTLYGNYTLIILFN